MSKKKKSGNKTSGANRSKANGPAKPEERSQTKILSVASDYIIKYGWILLLAVSVGLVSYYTLFPSRGYFHSDTTDTLMWAAASSESGTIFNPDFNYAGLLPFNTSLIMWALIPVFGVSMTTHVIGMLCFVLLYIAALVFMLRQMGWSWSWVALGVFTELMVCSGSVKLREIFWGHTIHYSLGVLFVFVGLGLLFRQLRLYDDQSAAMDEAAAQKNRKKIIIGIVMIAVWFVLTCTDQIIAIALFALPVMGALFCERFLDEESAFLSEKNRRALLLFCVMGAGMMLGYLLTKWMAGGITAGYEETFSSYSGMETWANHIITFPMDWITLLGAEAADGEPLMSAKSIGNLLLVISGVVLLVVPVIALACYKKIGDTRLRLLTLTYWFMTLLVMMGYILGKLSIANWRLSPLIALSAVVTVAFLRWSLEQAGFRRIIPLMMMPVLMVSTLTAFGIAKMPADNRGDNQWYAMAEELEKRGLNYGYGTFWTANALTVISDSKVKCRCIGGIDDNGPYKDTYQQCNSWFDDQPGQREYFLIASEGDVNKLKEIESPLLDHVVETIPINGWYVIVFDRNIF